jgi:peptidoglycan hydrolase-like protein with peptidoglycan-binding domain
MVPVAQSDAVRAFQSMHLFPASGEAFAYIPMGFTPFAMEIEGAERYFVWQIVLGDFAAFVEAKRQALTEDAFPTADLILQEALS